MSDLLIVDNYDSFTYNLYQSVLCSEAVKDKNIRVVRNDCLTENKIAELNLAGVVVSPGPGRPENAGASIPAIERCLRDNIPLLGVCLGHQALAQVFGGQTVKAKLPLHGYTSEVQHSGQGILRDLPTPFTAMRYHSLMVDETTLTDDLLVTARAIDDNAIMAMQCKQHPAWGLQFHPESFMTTVGTKIIENFLESVENACRLQERAA